MYVRPTDGLCQVGFRCPSLTVDRFQEPGLFTDQNQAGAGIPLQAKPLQASHLLPAVAY